MLCGARIAERLEVMVHDWTSVHYCVIRVSLCALQAFASERQMARMQEIADKKERGEF